MGMYHLHSSDQGIAQALMVEAVEMTYHLSKRRSMLLYAIDALVCILHCILIVRLMWLYTWSCIL